MLFRSAQFTNGTNFAVNSTSAYCFYYSSNSINIDNTNTFISATSNNLYGYASVYITSSLKISVSADLLAQCIPNQNSQNTCSTGDLEYSFAQNSGSSKFVLLCLECHYWLGECIFDDYSVTMTESFSEGYVDCGTSCVYSPSSRQHHSN